MKRRTFIQQGIGLCVALQIPIAFGKLPKTFKRKVKIGLITDLHHDIMHDAAARLEEFLTEMAKTKPDALIQLGDFAYPSQKNAELISLFNQAHETHLHVIGNHDTDNNHTKEECIEHWGMPARYYTKQVNGIRFIILDGNDKGSPTYKGGYPSYINPEQVSWLKEQLTTIQEPIIVVSHQPLAGPAAIDNAREVQEILSTASDKILLAINGHTHIDASVTIAGVTYVHINSASYFWAGERFKHNSYSEAVHKEHPWIAYTFPYQNSLFTTLEIDPTTSNIKIQGKTSHWQGKSPVDLGYKDESGITANQEIVPYISARHINKPTSKA